MNPYAAPTFASMAVPPDALTCPRCKAHATPAAAAQVCAGCGKTFALYAGHALEPSVLPPPLDARAPRIKVKSAGLFLMSAGVVAPEGVSTGLLDPITGMIPLDTNGMSYVHIATIAVWRRVAVIEVLVASLFPTPIALLCLWGAFSAPGLLVLALPFVFLASMLFYRAIGRRANFVRVVGAGRAIEIRFDRPFWRRQAFHDELLRRAGIAPSPIP